MNLTEQGFEVEVCQYGSPWQKPHVEYFNKELRDILPYDVDHSDLTHQNIENICYELNHKPRKLLEFSSSYEELQKFISIA